VQVLDTAGIRESLDEVEKIGIARSQSAAQAADLVLLTLDASQGWGQAEQNLYEQIKEKSHILVVNKMDLLDFSELSTDHNSQLKSLPQAPIVYTAAAQNQGIEELERAILKAVHSGNLAAADTDIAINQRQAAALLRAESALAQVQITLQDQLPLDFWTIDLRAAIHALGEVTGEEITESMLDEIFSRFCIGK
jgi:tRNA modification GTPase